MKLKFAASAIIIGTALSPAYSADQGADPKYATTVVKDSEITAKIKAKLAEEKFSSLATITIKTDAKGAVFLSGNVKSEQEADQLILHVHRIEGVTAVKSDFRIVDDK